jgi:hypothetical protein
VAFFTLSYQDLYSWPKAQLVEPSEKQAVVKSKLLISISISFAALALAGLHLAFPSWAIDAKTLVLIVIAILPWLGTVFESLEFPGGWKVKYRELKETEEKARKAGLLDAPPEKTIPSYITIADQDPNLALAGLRIEIEKRLRAIAESNGIDSRRLGLGQLLRKLSEAQAISHNERSVLSDMTSLLNNAAHGAQVEDRAAEWAIDVGSKLLATLDERIRPVPVT